MKIIKTFKKHLHWLKKLIDFTFFLDLFFILIILIESVYHFILCFDIFFCDY